MTGGTDDLERLEIELLLEAIYRHYGFDFRDYTFASIQRRIKYRMKNRAFAQRISVTSASAPQSEK
ncbi:hypothetical protein GCM10020331_043860 [Ectobacillus funiculus]